MTPQASTKVKVDQNGGLAILRFIGDITSASKDAVLGTYERLPASTKSVLLDFTRVPYLNSSGIALVIQLLMQASKNGRRVQTFGLTPHFQKVFTMLGLNKYTVVYPDEKAAIAGIGE